MNTIINRILVVALIAGCTSTVAHAAPNQCGDGTYDSVVGQYTGAHPDGSDPTNMLINVGGTGSFADAVSIGGGDWWTVGGVPNGNPGFVTLTWKKVKKGEYTAKVVSLQGLPTLLQPTDTFGVFPLVDFTRFAATVKVLQSSDCSRLEGYLVKLCAYNTGAVADMNVNTATPIYCTDPLAPPSHLLTLYKAEAP